MNCSSIRPQLTDWHDGGLAHDAAVAVESHVAACPDCRRESEALKQVRQALDLVPASTAEVDLPRLYRTAGEAQERRLRRWRRGACALGAVAAGLALIAVLPALEVRIDDHQLTARWGPTPVAPPPAATSTPPAPAIEQAPIVNAPAPDVEERLRLLTELVQVLADDAGKRDERRRRDLETLRAQINDLREQSRLLRAATERDVAALYSAQFSPTKKGQ
jgi:hypothetical protein